MNDPLDIEDEAALRLYLVDNARLGAKPVDEIRFERLSGGVSNRTVRLSFPGGEAWVLKQALPKLRVAAEWYASPARIEREALGIEELGRILPKGRVPALLFVDREHHLLAMEAVPEPHESWKTLLLAGRLRDEHFVDFGMLLGRIHARGYEERARLRPLFSDRSFFETLRVEPYYRYTAAAAPDAEGFLSRLIGETSETALTLVHGDFSPKNILVHKNALVLLDHEVIHFGDPAFDIGFSLTHFLSKANHLARVRERLIAGALRYWESYREHSTGLPWDAGTERRAVAHLLACLLSRVLGRSPLDYLSAADSARQAGAARGLMRKAPDTIVAAVGAFAEEIGAPAKSGGGRNVGS